MHPFLNDRWNVICGKMLLVLAKGTNILIDDLYKYEETRIEGMSYDGHCKANFRVKYLVYDIKYIFGLYDIKNSASVFKWFWFVAFFCAPFIVVSIKDTVRNKSLSPFCSYAPAGTTCTGTCTVLL